MMTDVRPINVLIEAFIARRSDLRSVAFRVVGRSDQVDDVLQDAYLKLVTGACARDVRCPYAYCCQVVRHMALDYCRRGVVEAACFVYSPDGSLPEVEGGTAPEAGIDQRRLLRRIDQALASLPPRTRRVFELYRLDGKTQREIGEILGVSATLVNFLLKDAREALLACKDVMDN